MMMMNLSVSRILNLLLRMTQFLLFFFSSRRRHTRFDCDWSSDVCSSDLPSYFPFTEPSVEFDVSCIFCGGSGTAAGGGVCSKCKGAGWIELFGAGMVDPAVYGFVKYDPQKVTGFAFGIGIDRLAMLKYGIDDIQAFFQNDVRFLRQFS